MGNGVEKAVVLAADWLHRLGIFICLPILCLLVTLDVALRYVFGSPLLWGSEVNSLLLILVLVTSVPQATALERHIQVTFIYERFSPFFKRLANLMKALVGMAFAGFLAFDMVKSVPDMIEFMEVAEITGLPHWPLNIVIILCAVTLLAQYGLLFVRALGKEKRSEI